MRVAIYARYSSDLQSVASIEDQVRECQARAIRDGHSIVETYADAAISGASLLNRPAINQLLADAKAGRFDTVLTEALDRMSRNLRDIAGLYERLSHYGVRILTLAEGEITELHVGLKGTMNALYLKDMAAKVRRGQRGRVEAGKSGGGLAYGYRAIRHMTAGGEVVCGDRAIDDAEAVVIRRIFEDYTAGKSPRAIAAALNAERVAGPRGRAWNASTIHGSAARRNGILHNELYVGRMTWNRQTFRKDPDTGRRVPRLNPPEQWVTVEVPHLRIVSDDLWNAAQGIRRVLAREPLANRARPRHPLSGLLRCGCCGGPMVKASARHFGCSRQRESGTCTNTRRVRQDLIEERVLAGIREHLLDPEIVKAYVEEYRLAVQEQNRTAAQRGAEIARKVDRLTQQIRTIVRAIAEQRDTEDMRDEMMRMDRERAALRADLEGLQAPSVVSLHPDAAERYRARVAGFHEALKDEATKAAIAAEFRRVIAEIRLTPVEGVRGEMRVDLVGRLAGIMAPEIPLAETFAMPAGDVVRVLVAPAGFEPATQGL